jgi:hypothetical protein
MIRPVASVPTIMLVQEHSSVDRSARIIVNGVLNVKILKSITAPV